MTETCVRCGAPIELYTLTHPWNGFPVGTQVWNRAEKGNGHERGRAVCDDVLDGMPRPLGGWTLDQLHSVIRLVVVSIEDAIAGLQAIELDLR